MRIYSIFNSVNGEVCDAGIGSVCTFIRFAGCSANCSYCDTEYAKSKNSGTEMTIGEVMEVVHHTGCKNITITGGEPMEQKQNLLILAQELVINGHEVSIETNGLCRFTRNEFPGQTQDKISFVVDIKSTGPVIMRNYLDMYLTKKDIIKQVVGTRIEFHEAISRMHYLKSKGCAARFAFSPEYEKLDPNTLLQWMKDENVVDALLNVQLHKVCKLVEGN